LFSGILIGTALCWCPWLPRLNAKLAPYASSGIDSIFLASENQCCSASLIRLVVCTRDWRHLHSKTIVTHLQLVLKFAFRKLEGSGPKKHFEGVKRGYRNNKNK